MIFQFIKTPFVAKILTVSQNPLIFSGVPARIQLIYLPFAAKKISGGCYGD